jgi:hypothetical protein
VDWFAVRHPETGGAGVIAESALDIHRGNGWIRVSGPIGEFDKDRVNPYDYDVVDLDVPQPEPSKTAKTSSKES